MFTGIIEDVGHLKGFARVESGAKASIVTKLARAGGIALGDSVCVNGCCLTATRVDENGFDADLSAETLARTNLGELAAGATVNLERSLPADGRLGGHIVSGHVDGVGEIAKIERDGETRVVSFRAPAGLLPYIAEKGSVAVNGVSLTVNGVLPDGFHVTLVPFTLEHTTFGGLAAGGRVNLEVDVLARYVVRALSFATRDPSNG